MSWDGEKERYAVWLDRPCYAKGKAEIVNLKHENIHPTFGRTLKEEQDSQVICHKMISVADITMEDMDGRRYMEYSNIYGAYNILVWFARKYPELYINDDTKETVLHYAAAQV